MAPPPDPKQNRATGSVGTVSQPAPRWLRWQSGDTPFLIIAPHGGERRAPGASHRSPASRVNDLHTAKLALEIAGDLAASFVINECLDRNVVDLNRLTQVRDQAPWFLAILEDLLENILARHAHAEILVIHGWNVVQAKCDFGVGLRLTGAGDASAREDETRTVSSDYLRRRLQPLRLRLRQAGIATAIGERYPARHPNNLLQLFRRGGADDGASPSRLRRWATSGRIEAVQWELGIPLRWPGPLRRGLREAVRGAGAAAAAPAIATHAPRREATTPLTLPAALRFFDPLAKIGMMAGIDPAPAPRRGVQGRVLLFLDAERIALFTGDEADGDRFGAGGPHFHADREGGFRFHFSGSTLETDDGRHYLDLEQALARSRLRGLDVALAFTVRGAGFGRVRGEIELGGQRWQVDAAAFTDPLPWRHWSGSRRSEWAISAAFDDGTALLGASGAAHLLRLPGDTETTGLALRAVRVPLERDGYTPRHFDLHLAAGRRLHLEPLGRISILRPVARRRRVHVTLGVARASLDGLARPGSALYEYARLCEL